MSFSMISTSTVTAFAKEKENTSLTKEEVKIADSYIHFNKVSNSFEVNKNELSKVLKQDTYNKVLSQVSNTNSTLKKSFLSLRSNNIGISVIDTDNTKIDIIKDITRGRGRNAIEFHWNYARIFIDAGNIELALKVGFKIGGIFAPNKIIKIVCKILGVPSYNIQHGIWFDYNYFIGVLCGNFGLQ